MTNKDLFYQLGILTKRNSGSDKVLCPKCSHTRKHKKDPCLSINIDDGTYNCHNPGCDFKGRVKERQDYIPPVREYSRPVFINKTDLTDNMVNWFFKRGITQKTLTEAKITHGTVWMPQVNKEVGTIQFNYFRDGELINVKYRDASKNFKMVKDAELIFYGLDNIKNSDWCIIVEGEMDCLSFLQVGIKEVVSVPNGASKGNANLEYLDNCIEYFENKNKIIIATDNDEAGIALRDELARRLGYERCYKVDFTSFKDANEILTSKGEQAICDLIKPKNLIDFPLSGIVTANMAWDDLELLFQNGLQRGDTSGVLKDFDDIVSFVPGLLMGLTGIPNHGKSPFALMIMCGLSVNHGYKWGIFSPEHKPLSMFLAIICECLLGKRMRKGVGFSTREKEVAKAFINEHFYFIEPEDEDVSVDNILIKAKSLVVKYGIRGLVIDPWNKLEHNIEKGDTETTYISKQLDKIIRYNQRHGVFGIIIAHPTKIRKDLKTKLYEVPNLYDISGSSNWFNKVDIGITFYRNYQTKLSEIHVQKMKYNHLGSQGMVEVKYNVNNSRFCGQYEDWDNSNWILPNETQSFINFSEPVKEQELTPESMEDKDIPF